MNIITLTLNPAFDIHCYTEEFTPFCENLFDIISKDAGGKGINISRALTENGTKNKAFVVVGDENGESFIKSLVDEKIDYKEIVLPGRIRENITLHTANQPETRISFSGFSADESVIDKLQMLLFNEDLESSIITFTGRLPKGVSALCVIKFLLFLKSKGAKIVLDSRSFGKNDILKVRPFLIKPNEEEIKLYSDISVTDIDTAARAAKELQHQGIENVMISLGAKGAVLACCDGVFFAKSPKINVVSTIGAGDSAIAGFITAIAKGMSYEEALKLSVLYGSAACMTKGTAAPKKEDIKKLFKEVTIETFR